MEEYDPILTACPLFAGVSPEDIPGMLGCLGARTVTVRRGQILFSEGDPARWVGIVLRGGLQLIREDYYGNRSVMAHLAPPEVFGESYACAEAGALPVSVLADADSEVLLVDCRRIVSGCAGTCSFHSRVVANLLQMVARKNLTLHRKIEVISRRSTREKLMAYLLGEAKRQGCSAFTIPFDRQALADYLEVDRSGLSAEISRLRREGILECEKSHFRIL